MASGGTACAGCRNPSRDILFESAASEFSDRVIGVVLTGSLKDGTLGLQAVHEAGGVTIVQDPAEAEYPDMPASATNELPVTFCLKLADIGPTLDLLARRKTELETGLAVSVRTLKDRVGLLVRLIAQFEAKSWNASLSFDGNDGARG